MASERYPGEQQGLRLFLRDLWPVVERELGRDCLLFHATRRALKSGGLDELRHARDLFNHLPRPMRARLSAGLVTPCTTAGSSREADGAGEKSGATCIAFDSSVDDGDQSSTMVSLRRDDLLPASLRVLISPDVLPRTAAGKLREIASLIERDRRLLSARYWGQEERGERPDSEPKPLHRPRS